MARVILLTQGMQTVVDDEDYEWLSQYKWCAEEHKNNVWYAVHTFYGDGYEVKVLMHRLIMHEPTSGVDHQDLNGLNNQRSNLRLATQPQNMHNTSAPRNNTSGYKGVSFHKASGKWRADICVEGKRIALGLFPSPEEAADAYDRVAVANFGEFARVNGN